MLALTRRFVVLKSGFQTPVAPPPTAPTRRSKMEKLKPPTPPMAALGSKHISVLTSLKGSLENILGESTPSRSGEYETPSTSSALPFTTPSPPFPRIPNTNPQTTATHSYYKAMNVHHQLYEGDVALQLRSAAVASHFRSPIWASEKSFARRGHTLRAGIQPNHGVHIHTATQSLTLYNLEQTNAPVASIEASFAAQTEWESNRPRNALGRPHDAHTRHALVSHALFPSYTALVWVTEAEAVAMGTLVAEGQRNSGVRIPPKTRWRSGAVGEHSIPGVSEKAREPMVLFNAEQLVDPALVIQKASVPTECLNTQGYRYNIILSLSMREHCVKYGLSVSPFAVFITPSRLRALGGEVRADLMPPDVATTGTPFTCVINDELVTLYHAEQTNMSTAIIQRAVAERKERSDYLKAKVH